MRNPVFAFCLVFTLLGLDRSSVAMDAAASPTAPSVAGRVGSLSPDEQRRAHRARQRAAAKTTSQDPKPHDSQDPPAASKVVPSRRADVAAVQSPRHRASTGARHRRLAAGRGARYRREARVRQVPRVGDLVPGDVRLYAIPAADVRDPYTGYPRSPPGFPPFPRP